MKKHSIRNLIIVFIIIIPLSFLILSYGNYKLNNVNSLDSSKVESYLLDITNQDGTIGLYSYLDFDCDGFYIIGPYTPSEYKHKMVGDKRYNYISYVDYLFNELIFHGDTIAENQQQLVFVKNNKVVSVVTLNRKDGDFLKLKEYYDIDTIFYNKVMDDGNYKTIVENN